MSPRAAIATIFTLNGLAIGTWGARVPAIQDRLDIGPGALALPLAGLSAGAILAMPLAGRATSRRGSRPLILGAIAGLAVALPLPALVPGLALVTGATLLMGLANGTLDVAMNTQGVAVERRVRRRILSSLHAGFSFGGLAGAGLGALAAAAGIGVLPHFAAMAAVILAAGVPCALLLVDDRRPPARTAPAPLGAPAPPPRLDPSPASRWRLRGIAFCCLLAEGAVLDWSAVHLRSIGATAAAAAFGYAGFSLAMASGRLAGDRLSERWGAVRLARRGGLVGAAALAAAIAAGVPAVAIAAYVVLGAGLSVLIPLVFRAAATGADAGPALAGVTTAGYLGFVVGPPVIGLIAAATSVPAALLVVVAAALLVGTGAGALEPRPVQDAAPPASAAPTASTSVPPTAA
ncbi:MAG TPA: MFS transporter [Baekduia sp.]|nr:MFS transporter [Baekduia sp.]